MPVSIKSYLICDKCGESKEINPICEFIMPGQMIIEEFIPEGWIEFRGLLLCPKHEIKRVTMIDGEEIE
jgi:hypothetical protein